MKNWMILSLLFISIRPFTQTTFQKFYGSNQNDEGYCMQKTIDGKLILGGTTIASGAGNKDILLLKVEETDGSPIWSKTYGGFMDENPRAIIQTTDQGFAVVGSTFSFGAGNEDVYLIKTDQNGNLEWSKTYGGFNQERGFSVKQTFDGGFIIGATTKSAGNGFHDAYVIKTDQNGNIQWSKVIGGGSTDNCFEIFQTADGGYVFTGSQFSFGAGAASFWVVKLDTFGNIVWTKTLGGGGEEHSRIIKQTDDDGFIIIGHTTTWGAGNWDIIVMKTDGNATVQWSKVYGGVSNDFAGDILVNEVGYLLGNFSESFGNGREYIVTQIDQTGNVLWANKYGFPGDDVLPFGAHNSILQFSTNSIFLTGTSEIGLLGGSDMVLIKMDGDGNSSCNFNDITIEVTSASILSADLNLSPVSLDNTNVAGTEIESFSMEIESFCTPPVAEFSMSDTIICAESCINFLDSTLNNPTSWEWLFPGALIETSNEQNPQNICFDVPGVYEIRLIASSSFGVDTASQLVTVLPVPSVFLGADTTLCIGETLFLAVNDPTTTSIEWQDGSTDSTFEVLEPGNYWVEVFNGYCSALSTIEVNFSRPVVELGVDTVFCENESFFLDAFQEGATYLWQDGSTNASLEIITEGLYYVDVQIGSCVDRDSIFLDQIELPVFDLGQDQKICLGDTIILSTSILDATYLWQDGSSNTTFEVTEQGVYWLEVTVEGCMLSDSIEVEFLILVNESIELGGDTTLCFGEELFLDAEIEGVQSYLWSDGSTSPFITVGESGYYWVNAFYECGMLSDNIRLFYEDCDCSYGFPNVFSPNLDGYNDKFTIITDCDILEYNMKIFDRWGELVFETPDYTKGWDGNFRSRNTIEGVYVFLVEAKIMRNRKMEKIIESGDVTLIR